MGTLLQLQAQKAPRGGAWLGSAWLKPSVAGWGQCRVWRPQKFPRAMCPGGREEPSGGPAGATGVEKKGPLLSEQQQGACPQTLLQPEMPGLFPGPILLRVVAHSPWGLEEAERGTPGLGEGSSCCSGSPASPRALGPHSLTAVLCPLASSPPSSQVLQAVTREARTSPLSCWAHHLPVTPSPSCESSGRPAGLHLPPTKLGSTVADSGHQNQACRLLPTPLPHGQGRRSRQLGSLEGHQGSPEEGNVASTIPTHRASLSPNPLPAETNILCNGAQSHAPLRPPDWSSRAPPPHTGCTAPTPMCSFSQGCRAQQESWALGTGRPAQSSVTDCDRDDEA